jgi:hypothetical protein
MTIKDHVGGTESGRVHRTTSEGNLRYRGRRVGNQLDTLERLTDRITGEVPA